MQPYSSHSAPKREALVSWLGLPSFHWSLALLGICIFTFVIVTIHFEIAAAGVAIGAGGVLLQKEKIRLPFPVWLFVTFVLWTFVASLASPYPDIALDHALELLKLLVIMIVAVNALQTEGQLRFYLILVLGCFMLYPVRVALVGYMMGGSTSFGRLVSYQMYANSNDFAALSLLALGVAMALTFSESSWTMTRLAAGLSAILLPIVILLTQSRGAFIGLVAGMGPALVLLGAKRPGFLIVYGGVVALVIGLVVPSSTWERLSGIEKLTSESTIAGADPEGSAENRLAIQKVALQIVADNPLFGVGLGAYGLENARYAPELGRRDTHNTYLNVAAEVGLPGLALWCALVFSVLSYAYRSRRRAMPGGAATQQAWIERAFWGYLVAGVFGSYAAFTLPYLMLAVLWRSTSFLSSPEPPSETAASPAKS